ncbi:hypothetical protein Hypma_014538 [Hypsizygus marmoreus]|uniref:Uncharacterized protein n=1 Tax=Hypsizygus marmoreus TaxID=39966 RepID=A0A369JBZ7_HYPMA|nr:hypothetical protein Hypma_014538 [Hypsizygus marmoreus]
MVKNNARPIHGARKPLLRLWSGKHIVRKCYNASPSLHSVAHHYQDLLREARVVDLAFHAFEHSNSDMHSTLRGYDSTGWETFAIHRTNDRTCDKIWLYFVDEALSTERISILDEMRSDVELTRVYYARKLTMKNFVRRRHVPVVIRPPHEIHIVENPHTPLVSSVCHQPSGMAHTHVLMYSPPGAESHPPPRMSEKLVRPEVVSKIILEKDSEDESPTDASEDSIYDSLTSSSSPTHASSSSLNSEYSNSFSTSPHADLAMLDTDNDMFTSHSHISVSTSSDATPTPPSLLQDQDLPLDFSDHSPALSLVASDIDGTFSPPDFQDQTFRPLHTIPSLTPSSERLSGTSLIPSSRDFIEDVVGRHRANTLDDVHNNDDHHEARSTADLRRCDTAREGSVEAPGNWSASLRSPASPHRHRLLPTTEPLPATFLVPSAQNFVEDVVGHRRANTLDNVLDNDDDPKTKTTSDAETHAVARDGTLQAAGMPNLPGPASNLADRPLLVADLPVHAHPPLPRRHPLSAPTERLPEISLMPSRPGFVTDDVERGRMNTFDSVHDDVDHHDVRNTTDPRTCSTAREDAGRAADLPMRTPPPLPHPCHLPSVSGRLSEIPLVPARPNFAANDVERGRTSAFDNMLDNDEQLNIKTTTGRRTHDTAREGTVQAASKSNSPFPAFALAEHALVVAGAVMHAHPPLSHQHRLPSMTESLSATSLIPPRTIFAEDDVGRHRANMLFGMLERLTEDGRPIAGPFVLEMKSVCTLP